VSPIPWTLNSLVTPWRRIRKPALTAWRREPAASKRTFVALRLDQQVEDLALAVDGSPRYMRRPRIEITISSRC
jgi:hypothetical protein